MSNKIFITKRNGQLHPANQLSEQIINKWPEGKSYSLKYDKVRNPKFHNMVFAVAQIAVDNAPHGSYFEGKSARHFIECVQMAYGFTDPIMDIKTGEMSMRPKSLKFENMTEDEFRPIFDPVVSEASKLIGCTDQEILEGTI